MNRDCLWYNRHIHTPARFVRLVLAITALNHKMAGPAVHIALLLHCITCNVLNVPFSNVIYVCDLHSIVRKRLMIDIDFID